MPVMMAMVVTPGSVCARRRLSKRGRASMSAVSPMRTRRSTHASAGRIGGATDGRRLGVTLAGCGVLELRRLAWFLPPAWSACS